MYTPVEEKDHFPQSEALNHENKLRRQLLVWHLGASLFLWTQRIPAIPADAQRRELKVPCSIPGLLHAAVEEWSYLSILQATLLSFRATARPKGCGRAEGTLDKVA